VIEQQRSRQTYRQISEQCGVARSSISRWLKRAGLNRLALLEPVPHVVRYEHPEPGDMLHLDIMKLGAAGQRGSHAKIAEGRRGFANKIIRRTLVHEVKYKSNSHASDVASSATRCCCQW